MFEKGQRPQSRALAPTSQLNVKYKNEKSYASVGCWPCTNIASTNCTSLLVQNTSGIKEKLVFYSVLNNEN